jgi:ADP-heptose:LPS heptosyltransferase
LNLVERTKYRQFLEGHPAIGRIGNPPEDASFISTNYWAHDAYRLRGERAYQVLARIFGFDPPVDERLFVPWEMADDTRLMRIIPWEQYNVLICQSSDSPRKQMRIGNWETLVEMLRAGGISVVQAGRIRDRYIRGAYSLLGLTTPRQLISLLRHFDAVVTADNFVMHAAYLCGTPAVVLWGPTDHRVYGYAGQTHLQARPQCEFPLGCIGPDAGGAYQTNCPYDSMHCMNSLQVDAIVASIIAQLRQKKPSHGRTLVGKRFDSIS